MIHPPLRPLRPSPSLPRTGRRTASPHRWRLGALPALAPLLALATLTSAAHAVEPKAPWSAPSELVSVLMTGNGRYVKGKPEHPHSDAQRRKALVESQHPFATVLSCSDSRVPTTSFKRSRSSSRRVLR